VIGSPHRVGCDTAVCLRTGMQRLLCGTQIVRLDGGAYDVQHIDEHPGEDCGQDIWTGQWPGEADAIRLGWWCYFVPNGNPSWVQCAPDHPEARPDLNRLAIDGKWNRELHRWEARDGR
jgi:hypothetical protein